MLSVQERERNTYEELMSAVVQYGNFSPGEQYLPAFIEMTGAQPGESVLDAGCSSGKGALALDQAGYEVYCTDLTDAGLVDEARSLPFFESCLWKDFQVAGAYDWVFCCDVLEHIPPQFTMLVISRLLEVSRRGVFLSIALMPDSFGAWVGKPLHQTVQPYAWWLENLREVGTVPTDDGSRDLLNTGLYVVVP